MKKIVSFLLIFTLILGSVNLVYATNENSNNLNGYCDWAKESIESAIDYKIVPSFLLSEFQKPITRKEFAKLIVNTVEVLNETEEELDSSGNPFIDTQDKDVIKAYNYKIVKGIGNNKYAPNDLISRQEIATMLVNMLTEMENRTGQVLLNNVESEFKFKDEDKIANWAKPFVKKAFKNKIMNGTGNNNVTPLGNTTREEAITLVKNIYENNKPSHATATIKKDVQIFTSQETIDFESKFISSEETETGFIIYFDSVPDKIKNSLNKIVLIGKTDYTPFGLTGKVDKILGNRVFLSRVLINDVYERMDININERMTPKNILNSISNDKVVFYHGLQMASISDSLEWMKDIENSGKVTIPLTQYVDIIIEASSKNENIETLEFKLKKLPILMPDAKNKKEIEKVTVLKDEKDLTFNQDIERTILVGGYFKMIEPKIEMDVDFYNFDDYNGFKQRIEAEGHSEIDIKEFTNMGFAAMKPFRFKFDMAYDYESFIGTKFNLKDELKITNMHNEDFELEEFMKVEGVDLNSIYLASIPINLGTMSVYGTFGSTDLSVIPLGAVLTLSLNASGELELNAELGQYFSGTSRHATQFNTRTYSLLQNEVLKAETKDYDKVISPYEKIINSFDFKTFSFDKNVASDSVEDLFSNANFITDLIFEKYTLKENFQSRKEKQYFTGEGHLKLNDGNLTYGPEMFIVIGGIPIAKDLYHMGIQPTIDLEGKFIKNRLPYSVGLKDGFGKDLDTTMSLFDATLNKLEVNAIIYNLFESGVTIEFDLISKFELELLKYENKFVFDDFKLIDINASNNDSYSLSTMNYDLINFMDKTKEEVAQMLLIDTSDLIEKNGYYYTTSKAFKARPLVFDFKDGKVFRVGMASKYSKFKVGDLINYETPLNEIPDILSKYKTFEEYEEKTKEKYDSFDKILKFAQDIIHYFVYNHSKFEGIKINNETYNMEIIKTSDEINFISIEKTFLEKEKTGINLAKYLDKSYKELDKVLPQKTVPNGYISYIRTLNLNRTKTNDIVILQNYSGRGVHNEIGGIHLFEDDKSLFNVDGINLTSTKTDVINKFGKPTSIGEGLPLLEGDEPPKYCYNYGNNKDGFGTMLMIEFSDSSYSKIVHIFVSTGYETAINNSAKEDNNEKLLELSSLYGKTYNEIVNILGKPIKDKIYENYFFMTYKGFSVSGTMKNMVDEMVWELDKNKDKIDSISIENNKDVDFLLLGINTNSLTIDELNQKLGEPQTSNTEIWESDTNKTVKKTILWYSLKNNGFKNLSIMPINWDTNEFNINLN